MVDSKAVLGRLFIRNQSAMSYLSSVFLLISRRFFFNSIIGLMSLFLAVSVHAQTDSDHTKKYNTGLEPYKFLWSVGAVSDYRSKGIDQTFGLPALQVEFGTILPNNFYVGTWNSNVTSGAGYPGALLETDLFVGWFTDIGANHINLGVYGALFPGSNVANYISSPINNSMSSGLVHNGDVFLAVRRGPITIQQNVTFTNAGNMLSPTGQSTAGSAYTNLTGAFPMPSWTWLDGGWSLITHAGYQFINNYSAASYFDWKLGVEKKIANMFTVDLAYVQTNAKGNCSVAATSAQPYCYNKYQNASGVGTGPTKNAGDAAVILSVKIANF